MPQVYRAILNGDLLNWIGPRPNAEGPVMVSITIVTEETPAEKEARRRQVAEALDQLAKMGGIKSISDPMAWQREVRRDRPLPGREEDAQ